MEHRLAALAVLIMLFLAACNGQPTPLTGDGNLNLADPDVGGGAGIVQPNETPGPLPSPSATPIRDVAPRATALPPLSLPSPTTIPATMPSEPSPEPSATTETADPSPEIPAPTTEPAATTAPADAEPEETAATEATAVTEIRPTTHVVVAGENLYRIGLQYGLSYIALAEYNGISNADAVSVGQELQIPLAEPTEEAAEPEQTATPTAVAPIELTSEAAEDESAPPATPESAGTPVSATPTAERTHTVQPGENLYRISQQVGVNWALIAEANGLISPNQIVVGQVLKIPTNAPGPAAQFTHQVHAGESLFRIALQYGVALSALAEANGLQVPTVIYPGQVLVIPGQGE